MSKNAIERSGRVLDVRCLLALRSLNDLEADLLAFFERFETVHLNRREMCKQILAAFIGRDESVAFRRNQSTLEKLDGTPHIVNRPLRTSSPRPSFLSGGPRKKVPV
jgi:hypothetical protein